MKRGPYTKTRKLRVLNPSGMCQCGCGQEAPLAPISNVDRGWVAGQHLRRIANHHNGARREKVKVRPLPNPSGFCMCGCGETTTKARLTRKTRGDIAGEFQRYVKGHATRKLIQYVIEDRGYETPCWIWQLYCDSDGYGHANMSGKGIAAHRAYYIKHVGPILPGMEIDHLCVQRPCVNPDHLEQVTGEENIRRRDERAQRRMLANC